MVREGNSAGHRVLRAPYPTLGLTAGLPDRGQGPRGGSPSLEVHTLEESRSGLDRGRTPPGYKSGPLLHLLPQEEGSSNSPANG